MLNQYVNMANPNAHAGSTGPEIWRQTEGKVTHFVAGTGTCGTITGNGRYLKRLNPEVKVIAVHPAEGHDIPGVRSLKQLRMTELFHPEEYDGLVEVSNEEAFAMCLRLNQEESLIAGPSSAMALVGALKVIEDTPDAVVVVIFPDNAFKYASTIERHFPQYRAADSQPASLEPSPDEAMLAAMVENSRNPHDTLEVDDLVAARGDDGEGPLVVDVRNPKAYAKQHIAGAVNIPVGELMERQAELPEGRDTPIVTACFRGNMSLKGLLVLKSLGYRNVKSLNGGTTAWAEEGHAVE
jgi:rhodanese-related sulfurtransferase